MDWRNSAACRVVDPELFFPIGLTEPALRQIREAKAVCEPCPVTGQCLSWAMETNQETGVWGGLDEAGRRSLRRRTKRGTATTVGDGAAGRPRTE